MIGVGLERQRELRPAFHLISNIGEDRSKLRVPQSLQHHFQSLKQRQTGLDKSRELLIEDQKVLRRNFLSPFPCERYRQSKGELSRPRRKDVVAPTFQIPCERLRVGTFSHLIEDPAIRSTQSNLKLHSSPFPLVSVTRIGQGRPRLRCLV